MAQARERVKRHSSNRFLMPLIDEIEDIREGPLPTFAERPMSFGTRSREATATP